jgi:hypothetical protein
LQRPVALNSAAEIPVKKADIIKEQAKPPEPNFWDFGMVTKDAILKHDFILKNSSEKTLNISGVNTSCGCTVSEITKNKVSPGESTLIRVSFNTKGYKGEVQQFVYVNTDDAENPVLKFTIKANVE